jgi:excisionase family DNA binding protein
MGSPTNPPPSGPAAPPRPGGPKAGEALLTVPEVAALWRCGRDKVYALIASGALRVVDIGQGRAKTRIPESALAEYVKRNERRASRGRRAA